MAAILALIAFVVGIALLGVLVVVRFPRGLFDALLLWLAVLAALWGVRRRGVFRWAGLVSGGILLAVMLALSITGELMPQGLIAVGLLTVAVIAARAALKVHVTLPPAARPTHPVVVWNARSGGGKAVTHHLVDEARSRGIEPIEIRQETILPPGRERDSLGPRQMTGGGTGCSLSQRDAAAATASATAFSTA